MNNLFNVLNIYCVNYIFIVICSIFDNGFFFFLFSYGGFVLVDVNGYLYGFKVFIFYL